MARTRSTWGSSEYYEVARAWASNKQWSGRTSPCKSRDGRFLSEGRLWFRDKTIYSYGTHFPIATLLPDGKTALVTDRTFDCPMRADGRESPTTRTHIGEVRNACLFAKRKIIYCDDPIAGATGEHDHNVEEYLKQLAHRVENLVHRRKPPSRINVPHSWDTDGSFSAQGRFRYYSDDLIFEGPLSRLIEYVDHFKIRGKFRGNPVFNKYVHPGKSAAEISSLLVDEVVQLRVVVKDRKRWMAALRRKARRAERRALGQKLLADQAALIQKRLTDKCRSTPPVLVDPEELYGLPVRRMSSHRRGLNLLVFN